MFLIKARATGVFRLNERDQTALNRQREELLAKSPHFSVSAEAVHWSPRDSSEITLGVKKRGQILASMRLDIVRNTKDTLERIDFDEFAKTLPYPSGLLCKATTHPSAQNKGLNSLLRFHAIKIGINLGLKTMTGTVVKGAPRTEFMKQLGYEFIDHKQGWRKLGYVSHVPVQVVVLDLQKNGLTALEILRSKIHPLLQEYPCHLSHYSLSTQSLSA